MSEQTLRRSNWPAAPDAVRRSHELHPPQTPAEDPLAELERIVMRGDPFGDQRRVPQPSNVETFPGARREPVFAEPGRPAPQADPFLDNPFGIDEAEFENALRGTIPVEPARPAAPTFNAPEASAFQPAPQPPMAAPEPFPPASAARPASADHFDPAFLSALDRELFGAKTPAAPAAARYNEFEDTTNAGPVYPDSVPAYDPDAQRPPVEEPADEPKRGKGLVTVAAVVGLVVVGAASAVGYTVFTGGARQQTGEPPVVRADNRPTRIVAEQPQQTDQNKIIYDRLGNQSTANERLVAREEQPVTNLEQRPEPRVILPGGTPQPISVPEPRRVTTTTIRVRADGTLESEPTRPPGAAGAAPARPATAPTPVAGAGQQAPATVQVPPTVAAPAPSAPMTLQSADPRRAPDEPARVPALAGGPAAPLPLPRPADMGGSVQFQPPSAPTQVAAVQPAVTAAPRAPAAAPVAQTASGGPVVQIASTRSEDEARSTFANLQRRFPQVLGDRSPNIRSFDLAERGTFWRVRVGGFGTRDEAAQFCNRLRSAGGECVIAAN